MQDNSIIIIGAGFAGLTFPQNLGESGDGGCGDAADV
jgi:NADH dehydrogenase FAD-containing subunit